MSILLQISSELKGILVSSELVLSRLMLVIGDSAIVTFVDVINNIYFFCFFCFF
jgi:hypothetical protein